tara:strand:- start:43 stop:777 length:735 start_codon:yes stop_codon:yes gene_type:complete
MKILHITDLHYTNKIGSRTKQKKLIDNFIDDLTKNVEDIDFVIFSGDLVNDGSSVSDFQLAREGFLEKILSTLKIEKKNLFICPGNHDVDRTQVSNSLIKYLDEEINNNDDLNLFFKKDNPDLINSHKPLTNYSNFIGELYGTENTDLDYNEDMYSTHIRNSQYGKIGIVCLNTAWRAIGQNDDTNLLYPIVKVDEALDRIISCEVKIVIHHHPLNSIKPFNLYDLEDLLHKRFDFMFSGHVHK